MDDHFHYIMHWVGSLVSTGALVGVVAGFLPPAAALGALVWYYIQITESQTYRRWRATRTQRRIAKLRAQLLELEAMRAITHETED